MNFSIIRLILVSLYSTQTLLKTGCLTIPHYLHNRRLSAACAADGEAGDRRQSGAARDSGRHHDEHGAARRRAPPAAALAHVHTRLCQLCVHATIRVRDGRQAVRVRLRGLHLQRT